jgi:hypothetical protein
VKGDDNPTFADRLAKFKQGVDIILGEHVQRFNHLKNARIEYSTGKRYIKMIYADNGSYSRRVHGFIDRTNGDILGSASYNAPAKSGARGSLWADDYGLNAVGEYGVHYKGGYSDHNWIVEIVNGE